MTNNNAGFSLIELMVGITIVTVFAAGATIKSKPLIESAKNAATLTEMRSVQIALLDYDLTNGGLPTSLVSLAPTYFETTSGYTKDAWGVNYTYNKTARTLCSTQAGCVSL